MCLLFANLTFRISCNISLAQFSLIHIYSLDTKFYDFLYYENLLPIHDYYDTSISY